jgi:hypothetical protein
MIFWFLADVFVLLTWPVILLLWCWTYTEKAPLLIENVVCKLAAVLDVET